MGNILDQIKELQTAVDNIMAHASSIKTGNQGDDPWDNPAVNIGYICGKMQSILLDMHAEAIGLPPLVEREQGIAMMQSIHEDPLYPGNFDLDEIKNMYEEIRADQIANQIKDCYYMRNILDEDGVVKEWQIFLSDLSDHPIRYGKSDSATIRGIMDDLGMVQARFTSKGELVELGRFTPKLRMFLYTHPKNLKDNPSDEN